jgi:hypothetical protein
MDMCVVETSREQWEQIWEALDWTEGVPLEPVQPAVPRQPIQARRDGKCYVYFIGGEGTPVKIGLSNQPYERLAALQTAHWCKLSILAKVEGKLADEKALHARFAAHRLHGEWFTRCPEIDAEIARLTEQEIAA